MPTIILLDASLSMLRPVEHGRRNCKETVLQDKISNGNSNLDRLSDDKCGGDDDEGNIDVTNNELSNSGIQLMTLAKWGIDKLLSHFEQIYKLEQVAVLSYSSQCELVAPFTRDIAEVRGKVILSFNVHLSIRNRGVNRLVSILASTLSMCKVNPILILLRLL